jgi:hypothetical protein
VALSLPERLFFVFLLLFALGVRVRSVNNVFHALKALRRITVTQSAEDK